MGTSPGQKIRRNLKNEDQTKNNYYVEFMFLILLLGAHCVITNVTGILHLSGADPRFLLTGFICERSERGERKRVVSSEARKYSWGVWGGAVSPPSGAGAEPRKFSRFSPLENVKSMILISIYKKIHRFTPSKK